MKYYILMERYMMRSKPEYVKDHIFQVLRLTKEIRKLKNK